MAEDLNQAKIYFWVCIKYVHNCHESGELQGFMKLGIIAKCTLLLYSRFMQSFID